MKLLSFRENCQVHVNEKKINIKKALHTTKWIVKRFQEKQSHNSLSNICLLLDYIAYVFYTQTGTGLLVKHGNPILQFYIFKNKVFFHGIIVLKNTVLLKELLHNSSNNQIFHLTEQVSFVNSVLQITHRCQRVTSQIWPEMNDMFFPRKSENQ